MNAVSRPPFNPANAYRHIYEQFALDASFLWILRSLAVTRPRYGKQDVVELDGRIQDQLDGLMTAPDDSWLICREAVENGDAGDQFVATVLAFRSLDVSKIQETVESGLANPHQLPGLLSALGWLPGRLCHSWIKRFLTSKDLNHKHLAVAACSLRREDPEDYLTNILQREDCLAHTKLHARALRLIGELKRNDLMPALRRAIRSDQAEIRFWALWSSILLGDRSALPLMRSYAVAENPFCGRAIQVAFRAVSVEEGRSWVSALASQNTDLRHLIKATAALGDPQAIDWLIRKMRIPAVSRLAGEAFTSITGIDLLEHNLDLKDLPNLDAQLPNDDPADDRVAMDEDEDLPFPDADKVAAVWQRYQNRFAAGRRYVFGRPPTPEHLLTVLESGHQRQRQAAALELSLLQPDQMLINCAAREVQDK